MLFWELYQQTEIASAQSSASRAEGKADRVLRYINLLEDKIDGMALTCQALWELLEERAGLTEEMVKNKMQEIDLRDGVQDGKMTKGATGCPACGRPVGRRHRRCIYCGKAIEGGNLFEKI
jgi:hypothetical protein